MTYLVFATTRDHNSIAIQEKRHTAKAAVELASQLIEKGCIVMIADPMGETFAQDQFAKLLTAGKIMDARRTEGPEAPS
jgi:uncharacterized protein YaiI (UPF0178 family)